MQFLGTSPVLLEPLKEQVHVPSAACVQTIRVAGSPGVPGEVSQWILEVRLVTLQLLLAPEPLAVAARGA